MLGLIFDAFFNFGTILWSVVLTGLTLLGIIGFKYLQGDFSK